MEWSVSPVFHFPFCPVGSVLFLIRMYQNNQIGYGVTGSRLEIMEGKTRVSADRMRIKGQDKQNIMAFSKTKSQSKYGHIGQRRRQISTIIRTTGFGVRTQLDRSLAL